MFVSESKLQLFDIIGEKTGAESVMVVFEGS